ncbi:MAG: bifunctional riboflavin kinase/FAD synthetase [Acidobacteria bacterium]|nr:bifunctional riboflavin kinase/FAD synthetase [Acidobacteriota bacterium]
MQVYRSLEEAAGRFGPCTVTIGNFDGTHVGHQELFREVALLAGAHCWTPAVLTFDPHPAKVVAPDRAPLRISTQSERIAVMERCGMRKILVLPFTRELALVPPDEFVRDILIRKLDVRSVVVGDNFRFGHRSAGDIHLLANLGRELGFSTHIEPAIRWRGTIISSTAVRVAVASGRAGHAARLLGRPYELHGRVIRGHGVGSKQTVPTLNLETENEVLPARGVYITRTRDLTDGREWESITNVGMRPTFDGESLTIETFLLGAFDGETPERIAVSLLRWVRTERKFESPEALKQQILLDVGRANAFHRRLARRCNTEIPTRSFPKTQ